MSEVEKTPMDKKNSTPRQLAQSSPRSSSDNGNNVNKFSGSYQKRDFGSVSNEPVQSKKYTQPREKANVKELGNGFRKFGSNQKRDFSNRNYSSSDYAQSKRYQPLEKGFDKRSLQQDKGETPGRRHDSSCAKGGMSSDTQSRNVGYRSGKEKHSYLRYSSKTPYSKEQFLQANCQFVVQQNGDYAIHANNPDMLVDWDLVEQVRIFDHEVPSCPICLYPPKAAKITRCGHTYCWPCMLHYMSHFDETYVNCPICYGKVREKDLKSVVALQTIRFSIGQEVTMKLMKKSRGQTLVSPRSIWSSELSKPFSVKDTENNCYAKLLIADHDYIKEKILIAEKEELLLLLQEDSSDTLAGSFIIAAMKSLEERAVKLRGEDLALKDKADAEVALGLLKEVAVDAEKFTFRISEVPKPSKRYASAFSDDEEEEEVGGEVGGSDIFGQAVIADTENIKDDNVTKTIEPLLEAAEPTSGIEFEEKNSLEALAGVTSVEPKASYYLKKREKSETAYFYQSADGQHIYLQGINISCLKAEYGDLSNCPDELTAKIVDLDRIFMDEDLRRKYRWLNHLPLTCEFIMVELDLKPPIVSQEILDVYADEILKRQQERERKQRYDNKRTQRIQKEECRKLGIDPCVRIVRSEFKRGAHPTSISTIDTVFSSFANGSQWNRVERPSVLSDDFVSESQNTEDATEGGMSRNSCSSEESCLPSVPSFAQMLKMGSPKHVSVNITEKASRTSDDRKELKGSDSDGEESARAPEYRNAFMIDTEQILAGLGSANAAEAGATETGNGGKKKKKAKKLLFTSCHMFHSKR